MQSEPVINGKELIISKPDDLKDTKKISYLIAANNINTLTISGDEIVNLTAYDYFKRVYSVQFQATKLRSLPDSLFAGGSNIKAVALSTNIYSIGANCFKDSSLKSINLDSVESIADNAFYECYNLLSIKLTKISTLGNSVFEGSALEKIEIGDSLFQISQSFAARCSTLTEIVIGSSVQVLGKSCFEYCIKLASFPFDTITTIQESAFQGSGLVTLTLTNKITSIGDYAFAQSMISKIVFSSDVTQCTLGKYAFYRCRELRFVSVPTNYVINRYMFSECMNLEKLIVNVTKVPQSFCRSCINLKSFASPQLTSIDSYAFYMCGKLETFDLSKVTQISSYAFAFCENLVIPEWNPKLYLLTYAFMYCLKIKITDIPKEYSVSSYNFLGCKSIESINVSTALATGIFQGCTGLKRAIISGLTSIPGSCFCNCTSLEYVELPGNLYAILASAFMSTGPIQFLDLGTASYIRDQAFSYSRIKTLQINKKLNVRSFPFQNMHELQKLIIGSEWSEFLPQEFINCTSLKEIEFVNNQKLVVSDGVVYNTEKTIMYYYLASNTASTYTIPDSVLYVAAYAFSSNAQSLKKIVVNNFASFASYAFSECQSITEFVYNIKTAPAYNAALMDPYNFEKSFPSYMFYDCFHLSSISIETELLGIGESCFENCYGLTSITFPHICSYFGQNVFRNCVSLKTIDFGSICHIPDMCFWGCTSLSDIKMSPTLTAIGNYAFVLTAITEIVVPDTAINVGYGAFQKCKSLKKVTLGNGLTFIPGIDQSGNNVNWFKDSSIETLVIPDSILDISSDAFVGAPNITIEFTRGSHPIFAVENNALIDKQSGTMITTFGTLPNPYTAPASVIIMGPRAINPYIDSAYFNDQKVYDKTLGTTVIKIPSSVKYVNTASFANSPYLYAVCYEGEYYISGSISDLPFLTDYKVTDQYANPRLFNNDVTLQPCEEGIPEAFLQHQEDSGKYTSLEKGLIAATTVTSVALVAVAVALGVMLYLKFRKKPTESMPEPEPIN